MSSSFASLVIAAVVWTAVHLGIAGTSLRTLIVNAIGATAFRIVFSLASFAIIFWLVTSYGHAGPVQALWTAPHWLTVACMLLMLPAVLLFVGSVSAPNPTMVAGGHALRSQDPARGIVRVTRHPMLWSFALWAAVHAIMLGTLAALVFFGAFLLVALAGMPSLDAKLAKRNPQHWPAFAQVTSNLPFVAIAQGRNRFAFAEIGWARLAAALALWFVLTGAHQWFFHIPVWDIFLGR
jgi:uncharacterized membrane protein